MIQDIYTRDPADPNYRGDVISHSNAIESIISKVKMILGTIPGQVLGDLSFGIGIEDLIFETKINTVKIEEKIQGQIYRYVSEYGDYDIQTKVQFGKGDGFDYCIIDIVIDGVKASGVLVK